MMKYFSWAEVCLYEDPPVLGASLRILKTHREAMLSKNCSPTTSTHRRSDAKNISFLQGPPSAFPYLPLPSGPAKHPSNSACNAFCSAKVFPCYELWWLIYLYQLWLTGSFVYNYIPEMWQFPFFFGIFCIPRLPSKPRPLRWWLLGSLFRVCSINDLMKSFACTSIIFLIRDKTISGLYI